jgi:hypothetical protein
LCGGTQGLNGDLLLGREADKGVTCPKRVDHTGGSGGRARREVGRSTAAHLARSFQALLPVSSAPDHDIEV